MLRRPSYIPHDHPARAAACEYAGIHPLPSRHSRARHGNPPPPIPSFSCSTRESTPSYPVILVLDTGIHPFPSRHSRARYGNPRPWPIPSFSCSTRESTRSHPVILVLDTGIHAPSPSRRSRARHGNPPAPTPSFSCSTRESTPLADETAAAPPSSAPPPTPTTPLPCLLKPALSPSKGAPETTWCRRAAAPARFTSKCREMSQNVPLFRPSTRKPMQFTSGESHVLGRFPAISAHFCSFLIQPPHATSPLLDDAMPE